MTVVADHVLLASQWHPALNGDLTPEKVTVGSQRRVWWQCAQGHEWEAIVKNRLHGGCPVCSGKKVLAGYNDLATIHPLVAQRWHPTLNGDLTPEMVRPGSNKRVWWQCELGHEWLNMVYQVAIVGAGCPVCSNRVVLAGFNDLGTLDPVLAAQWHPRNELAVEEAGLLTRYFAWWVCSKGHEWQARTFDRASSRAVGCPTCAAHNFVSRGEQEIADYLSRELGLTIEQSNRSLLRGTELDIYIPSKKLAIEYNGLYWHSSAQKVPGYHQDKYELAREAGIQLIQIWEDEWRDKQELVKRLLAHKLGESRKPLVGARQTRVEAIPLAEARIFLNEHHIQGHTNGSHYLGLRSQKTSELVAVMVMVKRASLTGLTLEIVRYATSCRVPGGFTKFLKYVANTLQPSRLVTFADHCISDGSLYAQNGFTAEKELSPDYRYLVNNGRAHKFGYRLARFRADPSLLWEPNLTETQLAQLNGLHRVYDAGKTRWGKTL